MTGSLGGDFLLILGVITAILWALGSMMDPPPPTHHWTDWKEPKQSAEDEEAPPESQEDRQAAGPREEPRSWLSGGMETPPSIPPLA